MCLQVLNVGVEKAAGVLLGSLMWVDVQGRSLDKGTQQRQVRQ